MDNGTKWRIGDVEISRIPEFEMPLFDPAMIYPDLPKERLDRHRAWLEPRFLDPATGKLNMSIHAFVIRTKRHAILVDACSGNDKERPSRPLFHRQNRPWLDRLGAAGFKPGDIDYVLCTHLHIDHVGWNTRLVDGRWVPTFPHARYLFGRREWEHWKHLRSTNGYHDMAHLIDAIDPVLEAGLADFIDADHQVTDEVSLFPTPGHTPGHVSVRIRSRGEEAVITGDMMHHPIQFAVPDLHGNFDMDKEQGARTRRAFIERFQDRKALIIGSHFCDPTSGWIERDGAAWKLALK